MPVPVRADVTEENLRQLLAEAHESETLDYKGACDLSNRDELLEIVKDLGAMQILGGYIVIGADNRGNPTHGVTSKDIKLFDEAQLRSKIRRYLPEPFTLRTQNHTIDGHDYILVYVGENPEGFAVFAESANDRKNNCVFREGDVFARHGTSSERWNQHDIAAVRKKIREREREHWMAEMSSTSGKVAARELAWNLDSGSFLEIAIEQLRNGDTIPLKLLLNGVPSEVGRILAEENPEERLSVILDRLTCLASLLLQLDVDELFRAVVGAFVSIYNAPVDRFGGYRADLPIQREQLWLMVQERIIGIGALAERLKRWDAVRFLVLQKGKGIEFDRYPNWYRHALTMAARANLLLLERDGRTIRSSLLAFAQQQAERLECLRSDLSSGDEELLSSLCRFDILASLVGIDDAGGPDGSAYYPNFARYFSERSTPAINELLRNEGMRAALFRGSDEKLAEALLALERSARQESVSVAGWTGFHSDEVRHFLDSVVGGE